MKADFGVIGYTHSYDDWTAAEPQSKPNVFYKQKVTWYESKHEYTPMQQWQGKQLYAFFAYCPFELTVSPKDLEGNPYVDFEFKRNDLANQVDVMTGQVIDADYKTRSVAFDMKHRLTALDVVANNLYTDVTEIQVTSMTIKLENILYDKVRIPLNMRDEPGLDYSHGEANDKTAEYNLLPSGTGSITNKPNTPLTSSEANTTMILIPQNQSPEMAYNIKGSIEVAYKTLSNGTTVISTTQNKDFVISRDLIPGYRYYIQLNFAAGDITVAILESDMWDELRIKHDFE